MRPLPLFLLIAACTGKGPADDTDPDCVLVGWYPDADDDGFGDMGEGVQACIAPAGYVDNDRDCDDADPAVHPDATERCDRVDNDCDGATDADDDLVSGLSTYYRDADADTYGDPDAPMSACEAPSGYVANDDDCDDGNPANYPGGREVCDGGDNDCDERVDDDDSVVYDAPRWYPDHDADNWGADYGDLTQCEAPEGYIDRAGDCEDLDPAIHPAATEVCDLIDNDCDDRVDEEDDSIDVSTESTWYPDADADGWGDEAGATLACFQPDDYTDTPGDCDDGADTVYPGAVEYCNDGLDQDCVDGDATCEELGSADAWTGASTGDQAGDELAAVGDLDGDGFGDWAAGAPRGLDDGVEVGIVYVMSATASPGAFSDASLILVGEFGGDRFGSAIAGGTDVDGDAVPDLLVGASRHDRAASDAGAVYLISGAEAGTFYPNPTNVLGGMFGEAASDYFGTSVDFAGDQDEDGNTDYIIGASGHDGGGSAAGAAYIVTDQVGFGSLNGTWYTWTGEGIGDQAGTRVRNLGDVDGDGNTDFGISAPQADSGAAYAGAVYVLLGPVLADGSLADADARWYGTAVTDRCGVAFAGGGDHDGDGLADLLVGCSGADDDWLDAGALAVVHAPGTGGGALTGADLYVTGESPEILLGESVSWVPDLDGDGLDELLGCAPQEDSAGTDAGAVYLLYGGRSGAVSAADADTKWIGEAANDQVGDPLLAYGDLTGDGVADFLFASPDASRSREGRVYRVEGR